MAASTGEEKTCEKREWAATHGQPRPLKNEGGGMRVDGLGQGGREGKGVERGLSDAEDR